LGQALHAGAGHLDQLGAGAHALTSSYIAHQSGPGGDECAMRKQMREEAEKARATL
jgi:hypothetical protein